MKYKMINRIAIIQVKPSMIEKKWEAFTKELEQFIQTHPSLQAVLLHFNQIGVVNSQSLGLLVTLHKMIESHQKKLGLCHFSEVNLEVIRLSQLDRILAIFSTEEEALAGLLMPVSAHR